MPTMIDIGVARPSAQGQAMTSTATVQEIACDHPGPQIIQAIHVNNATPTTTGTNQPDTRSASRWIGARERWASATIWTMRESRVSEPIRSAVMRNAPVWLRVAPVTESPGFLATGIDSPVIMDSSTVLFPSVITPSTGTFSPGRTRSTSPTFTSASATSCSFPATTRRAVFAASWSSDCTASPVLLRARASSH